MVKSGEESGKVMSCVVLFSFGLGSRGVSLSYIIVKCDTLFACKVEELS